MRVAVIGAGLSGLSATYWLKQRGIEVRCFEKGERAGGLVQTLHEEKWLFERGPRGVMPRRGLPFLELVEKLGLASSLVWASPSSAIRYLWQQNKLTKLPSNAWQAAFSPLLRPLWKALLREWRQPRCMEPDESIASFFRRRLGSQVCETLLDPLVWGVFGGDKELLSMQQCMESLWHWEQESGSLTQGFFKGKASLESPLYSVSSDLLQKAKRAPLASLQGGMGQLVQKLVDAAGTSLQLGSGVEKLEKKGKGFTLHGPFGRWECERIIAAISPCQLAPLVKETLLLESTQMASFPMSSLVAVHFGYDRPWPIEGFGYLVPSCEKQALLGAVWDSQVFPQHNKGLCGRVTAMLRWEEEKDDVLQHRVFCQLQKHTGVDWKPQVCFTSRAKQSLPAYPVGYRQFLCQWKKAFSQHLPGVFLCGQGFDKASVSDCLASGKKVALQIASFLLL